LELDGQPRREAGCGEVTGDGARQS
jgi:hypothetical protein